MNKREFSYKRSALKAFYPEIEEVIARHQVYKVGNLPCEIRTIIEKYCLNSKNLNGNRTSTWKQFKAEQTNFYLNQSTLCQSHYNNYNNCVFSKYYEFYDFVDKLNKLWKLGFIDLTVSGIPISHIPSWYSPDEPSRENWEKDVKFYIDKSESFIKYLESFLRVSSFRHEYLPVVYRLLIEEENDEFDLENLKLENENLKKEILSLSTPMPRDLEFNWKVNWKNVRFMLKNQFPFFFSIWILSVFSGFMLNIILIKSNKINKEVYNSNKKKYIWLWLFFRYLLVLVMLTLSAILVGIIFSFEIKIKIF